MKKLSPGNLVILIAGAVILIASFLAFYKYDVPKIDLGDFGDLGGLDVEIPQPGDKTFSAWNGDLPLFPVATLPALFGLLMALQVGLTAFAKVRLPERPAGLTWDQVHLVLGFQSALMMLCYLIVDKSGLDLGIGFFLMLLSAIALAVGAVLRTREASAAAPPPLG
jgi:hypothetical protein